MRRIWTIIIATLIVIALLSAVSFWFREDNSVRAHRTVKCEFEPKINNEDGEKISELINTMADTSVLGLAFKKNHLESLGDEIHKNVAPCEFLSYIFGDEKLAHQMGIIRRSSFKYNHFIEGLQANLVKESEASCFEQKVKIFAKHLKIDPEVTWNIMNKCVARANNGDDQAFGSLVNYLIEQKSDI